MIMQIFCVRYGRTYEKIAATANRVAPITTPAVPSKKRDAMPNSDVVDGVAEQEDGGSGYGRSLENRPLRCLHSSQNTRKIPVMTNAVLLAVCAVLVGFGIFVIAVSSGFFMNLLGAGTIASGGSAAYLILSHRK